MTLDTCPRDASGYGADPPHARWPNGARIALQFVLNVDGSITSPGTSRSGWHGGSMQLAVEAFPPVLDQLAEETSS